MKFKPIGAIAFLAALIASLGFGQAAAAAASEENFQVRTTQDLIILCTATSDDPLHIHAIHLCQGYLLGLTHYHDTLQLGPEPAPALFCPPDPRPSRNEVIAAWIEWSTADSADDTDLPLESILRYLVTTYPCGG